MKGKKILSLFVIAGLVAGSSLLAGCGAEAKENNKEVINENIESSKEENNKESNTEEIKEEKIDFSKHSDSDILEFTQLASDAIIEGKYTGLTDIIYKREHALYEISESVREQRENLYNKYYAPDLKVDEYVEEDGKIYYKDYYYEGFIPYTYNSVKSKEVIDDTTLRVVFDVELYHGFPVVNKNIKTIDFTEVNGELRAKTLLYDVSMYNVIESPNEEKGNLNDEGRDLHNYVYEKLNDGILDDDELFMGLHERTYDASTDSIYYQLEVKTPTQSSISYFVNIKNGDIYGHYENKFVVKDGKVVK